MSEIVDRLEYIEASLSSCSELSESEQDELNLIMDAIRKIKQLEAENEELKKQLEIHQALAGKPIENVSTRTSTEYIETDGGYHD